MRKIEGAVTGEVVETIQNEANMWLSHSHSKEQKGESLMAVEECKDQSEEFLVFVVFAFSYFQFFPSFHVFLSRDSSESTWYGYLI